MAEETKRTVADVTILINNAGIVSKGTLAELADEAIERVMNVNILSHFWTVKAFLPAMLEKNHGHIVTIASMMGQAPLPSMTAYVASKYAAVGFTGALRMDIMKAGKAGVKTTLVCPNLIDTGMFAGLTGLPMVRGLKEGLKPNDVAAEVVSAVRRGAPSLVLPGTLRQTLLINSIMPEEAQDEMHKILGLDSMTDTFRGSS
eukprot:NODE_2928_length_854_cov_357.276596.p1 GENE.NODE_2928_length_854_cov_357.276596~~NODE_2928_length_854_cov_357.276596.p1  ORF type:complete len:221 (-),score=62.77 NODE_2928_length_854_cov_357.276596:191-796(-)